MRTAALLPLLFALGCVDAGPPPKKEPVKQEKKEAKSRTREELKGLVTGKTKAEVLKALGRPEGTLADPDGGETWHYENASYDPVAQKPDRHVWIKFDGAGRVEGMHW